MAWLPLSCKKRSRHCTAWAEIGWRNLQAWSKGELKLPIPMQGSTWGGDGRSQPDVRGSRQWSSAGCRNGSQSLSLQYDLQGDVRPPVASTGCGMDQPFLTPCEFTQVQWITWYIRRTEWNVTLYQLESWQEMGDSNWNLLSLFPVPSKQISFIPAPPDQYHAGPCPHSVFTSLWHVLLLPKVFSSLAVKILLDMQRLVHKSSQQLNC